MLPLAGSTLFTLGLIGVALCAALAAQSGLRWRIILGLVACVFPVAYHFYNPPSGQYAWLWYFLVAFYGFAALGLGVTLGLIARALAKRSVIAATTLTLVACSASAIELNRQSVPETCRTTPLQIRVADELLTIPPEMTPTVYIDGQRSRFGRLDEKTEFARVCRLSHNGERILDVDAVEIHPASSHVSMTAACNLASAPLWCSHYSVEPYRFVAEIAVLPEADRDGAPLYWSEGETPYVQEGDLRDGVVCLPPSVGRWTQCWTWALYGEAGHLFMHTTNLDPEFEGLPVEDAQQILDQTLEMVLSIIAP